MRPEGRPRLPHVWAGLCLAPGAGDAQSTPAQAPNDLDEAAATIENARTMAQKPSES